MGNPAWESGHHPDARFNSQTDMAVKCCLGSLVLWAVGRRPGEPAGDFRRAPVSSCQYRHNCLLLKWARVPAAWTINGRQQKGMANLAHWGLPGGGVLQSIGIWRMALPTLM